MFRHMDTYLEVLVEEERYAFYQAVCDFAEKHLAPHVLTWNASIASSPMTLLPPWHSSGFSVSPSPSSMVARAAADGTRAHGPGVRLL
jgi:hypothetical protein